MIGFDWFDEIVVPAASHRWTETGIEIGAGIRTELWSLAVVVAPVLVEVEEAAVERRPWAEAER